MPATSTWVTFHKFSCPKRGHRRKLTFLLRLARCDKNFHHGRRTGGWPQNNDAVFWACRWLMMWSSLLWDLLDAMSVISHVRSHNLSTHMISPITLQHDVVLTCRKGMEDHADNSIITRKIDHSNAWHCANPFQTNIESFRDGKRHSDCEWQHGRSLSGS